MRGVIYRPGTLRGTTSMSYWNPIGSITYEIRSCTWNCGTGRMMYALNLESTATPISRTIAPMVGLHSAKPQLKNDLAVIAGPNFKLNIQRPDLPDCIQAGSACAAPAEERARAITSADRSLFMVPPDAM